MDKRDDGSGSIYVMSGRPSRPGCPQPPPATSPGCSVVPATGREGLAERIRAVSEIGFSFCPPSRSPSCGMRRRGQNSKGLETNSRWGV